VADLGMPLQINSTIGRLTYPHLDAMIERVRALPIALWAVFFLIATGRGAALDQIDAGECEHVLNVLCDLAPPAPFGVQPPQAPHNQPGRIGRAGLARSNAGRPAPSNAEGPRAGRSVTDGNGFVFIDHVGQIYPSGFLPMVCGSVGTDSLVRVY